MPRYSHSSNLTHRLEKMSPKSRKVSKSQLIAQPATEPPPIDDIWRWLFNSVLEELYWDINHLSG